MLKYYFLERTDRTGNGGYSSYDEYINNTVQTLYIVDMEDEKMTNIFDDLVSRQNAEFENLVITDEEQEEVFLEALEYENEDYSIMNIIDLINDNYKTNDNLKSQIKRNNSILFLADYKPEYIALIEWLMIQNEKKKLDSQNNRQSIHFLHFQLNNEITYDTDTNNKIYEKYIKICSWTDTSENDNSPLAIYNKTHNIKDDQLYLEISKNIDIYQYQYNNKESDSTLEWLPNHAQYLSINHIDNLNISINKLHPTLKYLSIKSDVFNQPVDNLPLSLECLHIESQEFDQSLDYLPIGLKCLQIKCYKFNHSIDNLPLMLETFQFTSRKFTYNINNLPNKLNKLYLDISGKKNKDKYNLNNLPDSLESLYIYICNLNDSVYNQESLKIPLKLKCLNYDTYRNMDNIVKQYPHLQRCNFKKCFDCNSFKREILF